MAFSPEWRWKMPPPVRQCDMANRIRELREGLGLSQERLAERVGTSGQQISRLENGERRLTQGWMRRVSAAIGCAPTDLLPEADRQVVARDHTDDLDQGVSKALWLRIYEDLSPDGRRAIINLIRTQMVAEVRPPDNVRHRSKNPTKV